MVSPLEESVTVAETWIDEQIAYAKSEIEKWSADNAIQTSTMTMDCLLRLLNEVRNLLTNIRVTLPPKGGA